MTEENDTPSIRRRMKRKDGEVEDALLQVSLLTQLYFRNSLFVCVTKKSTIETTSQLNE